MKALILGGGGREHALAWKLKRDDPSLELLAAPGNPGIAELARCVAVSPTDVARVVDLAASERVDVVVVGPEAPLAAGVVDALRANRIAAGEAVTTLMIDSRGASNAKARAELGWRPAYPTWREGFRSVLAG